MLVNIVDSFVRKKLYLFTYWMRPLNNLDVRSLVIDTVVY